MNNLVYLVMMYRFGHKQGHSYLLGVFRDLEHAKHEAEEEMDDRGGKYAPEITEVELDADQHSRIVWPVQHSRKEMTIPVCEQCGQRVLEGEKEKDSFLYIAEYEGMVNRDPSPDPSEIKEFMAHYCGIIADAFEAGVDCGLEKGGDTSMHDTRDYVNSIVKGAGLNPPNEESENH